MKTISIPVNNRPELLNRVIDSINKAEGSGEWRFVFSCEPGARIPKGLSRQRSIGTTNAFKMGCWSNTFNAANLAMTLGSDVNLYLEDDYMISKDALLMVNTWLEIPSSSDSVLCLRRPDNTQDQQHPETVSIYRTGLFGCGFAWRKDLWPLIREIWWRRAPMWDIAMEQLNVPQWRPMVNRSRGIGLIGTHTTDGHDANLFGSHYEGNPITKFTFNA